MFLVLTQPTYRSRRDGSTVRVQPQPVGIHESKNIAVSLFDGYHEHGYPSPTRLSFRSAATDARTAAKQGSRRQLSSFSTYHASIALRQQSTIPLDRRIPEHIRKADELGIELSGGQETKRPEDAGSYPSSTERMAAPVPPQRSQDSTRTAVERETTRISY